MTQHYSSILGESYTGVHSNLKLVKTNVNTGRYRTYLTRSPQAATIALVIPQSRSDMPTGLVAHGGNFWPFEQFI